MFANCFTDEATAWRIFTMGTNRVTDPFDELTKTIATDLAYYLKTVSFESFNQVLDNALYTYQGGDASWLRQLVYWFSRQRGKDVLDQRDKLTNISQLVKGYFQKGTWEEGSFNTKFMHLLIKQLDGYGPTSDEKINKFKLNIKNFYLEIKDNLFFAIDLVENLNARSRLEESEQKLAEVQKKLEDKQQELVNAEMVIEEKHKNAKSVDEQISAKKKMIAEEVEHIEKERQQALVDMEEARLVLKNVINLSPKAAEEINKVMEIAALNYLAEQKHKAAKDSEIAETAKQNEESRLKALQEKEEREKKEAEAKLAEINERMTICKARGEDNLSIKGFLKQALAMRLPPPPPDAERKKSLYKSGQHATIHDANSMQKALEAADMASDAHIEAIETKTSAPAQVEKPKLGLSAEDKARLKEKRAQKMASSSHLISIFKDKCSSVKTAPAKKNKYEPVRQVIAEQKPIEVVNTVCPDGEVRQIPIPPPPPPGFLKQSLFAAAQVTHGMDVKQDEQLVTRSVSITA